MRLAAFFAGVARFLSGYIGRLPAAFPWARPQMALSERSPFIVRWDTGLKPEMLQALGTLAVFCCFREVVAFSGTSILVLSKQKKPRLARSELLCRLWPWEVEAQYRRRGNLIW